jgi:HAD superfamily hydrolase (TIGR01484 family)
MSQAALALADQATLLPIGLVLFDIDGVLTAGEARALDLDLLRTLADMNRSARANPAKPAVTLCTGRPAPYVEVMTQAIDGHLPAVYENGCGLYIPSEYRFVAHPLLGDGQHFASVRERLRESLVRPGKVFFQPGKEHSLSLFPLGGVRVDELKPMAEDSLGSLAEYVSLVYSESCLNVIPRGVDKGQGLNLLCELAGASTMAVLGVGDSDVDLPFLAQAGRSAAPANANSAVRKLVHYVSKSPNSAGAWDILRYFGLLA